MAQRLQLWPHKCEDRLDPHKADAAAHRLNQKVPFGKWEAVVGELLKIRPDTSPKQL